MKLVRPKGRRSYDYFQNYGIELQRKKISHPVVVVINRKIKVRVWCLYDLLIAIERNKPDHNFGIVLEWGFAYAAFKVNVKFVICEWLWENKRDDLIYYTNTSIPGAVWEPDVETVKYIMR